MDPLKFATVLAAQDGVISMSQARDCGLSESAVQRRLNQKLWTRLAKGVYLSIDHVRSHNVRLRAAMLSVGDGAVCDGWSAAWWHGLADRAPARHSITIPTKRTIQRTRVRLRRRDLKEADITEIRGVRCTGLPLTVLEVGDSVLMDRALQTVTNLEDLRSAHSRNLRYAGSARAARLLAVAATGGRSEAERLLHRIIRPLSGWRAQFPIGPFWVDAVFEKVRLVIEVDGWRWHKDSGRNSLDMMRQNYLTNQGWRVLRYDWHRLAGDPAGVLAEIEAAVKTLETRRSATGF